MWKKLARIGAHMYPKKSNICRSMVANWNEKIKNKKSEKLLFKCCLSSLPPRPSDLSMPNVCFDFKVRFGVSYTSSVISGCRHHHIKLPGMKTSERTKINFLIRLFSVVVVIVFDYYFVSFRRNNFSGFAVGHLAAYNSVDTMTPWIATNFEKFVFCLRTPAEHTSYAML